MTCAFLDSAECTCECYNFFSEVSGEGGVEFDETEGKEESDEGFVSKVSRALASSSSGKASFTATEARRARQ